jgi:hypothetical protein
MNDGTTLITSPARDSRVCRPALSARLLLAGLGAMLIASAASADIRFQDVSGEAGVSGFTESWGSSWGDLNSDGWPDLWIQGHNSFPRVYRNTGGGRFEDVAYQIAPSFWFSSPEDKHGASWGDFDNDGDLDLLQSVSATGNAQLMVNTNGTITDRAVDADLASDSAARQPVWFDYTGDGFLDVAQLHTSNGTLRRQDPAQGLDFDDDASGAGFSCPGQLNYGQMLDVTGNGKLEFICAKEGNFPLRVFDVSQRPFLNVTSSIPAATQVNDTIVGDFNRDLRNDIIMTRGSLRPSGATLVTTRRIESWLRKGPGSQQSGYTFSAPGQITVTIDHEGMGQYEPSKVFVLDTAGPTSVTAGPVRVSYDAGTGLWSALLVHTSGTQQAYIVVETVEPVTGLTMVNLASADLPRTLSYLESSPQGMAYRQNVGLEQPVSCVSGVAGDFDNDMDMDLFLVCRSGANNLPDRLYENLGNGTFALVPNSGAEGVVGAGAAFGVGESATLADYDVDGFLDIFVMNGLFFWPRAQGGPEILLRNVGNGNSWVEIDLVGARRSSFSGTLSNRDGVGAKVFVTAGGVTQVREQNGGYHRWSQNHQRLHFGLAGNQTIDTVRIEWPSGRVDTFSNVAANQLYKANEGGTLDVATLGPPVHTSLQPGDECGAPPYNFNVRYGPAMMLWRDCPGNTWHFRSKGGRVDDQPRITEATITADTPFGSVTGHQLGSGDSLDNSVSNVLSFRTSVWFTNDKGVNFATGGQSSACLAFSRQDIDGLIVGASRKRISGPIDLFTLQDCTPPEPNPECGAPSYDRATEVGVFVWRNCAAPGSTREWQVRVTGGGSSFSAYEGVATSDVPLSATGVGLESNDTLDSVPNDETVEFILRVGGNGEDGFRLDVPAGSATCFDVTVLKPGAQVELGAGRQVMSGPFDLETLGPCN